MDLRQALRAGNPAIVRSLIEGGQDIHYRSEDGYTAIIDAVYFDRDIRRDPRLLELLALLIECGVDLNAYSRHGQTVLDVLSGSGRFDAIAMLIEAGADPQPLQWTRLMWAVALGTLADVRDALAAREDLEIRDSWSRTPWMVALLIGDIDKATLLMESGADINAVDHVDQPALFHAIQGGQPQAVRWLLETVGVDLRKPQQLGRKALRHAAWYSELECVNILLDAGAEVTTPGCGSPLVVAETREIALRLLEAGADPSELRHHVALGLPGPGDYEELDENPLDEISKQQFLEAETRVFGRSNPERQNFPFWMAMVRTGICALIYRMTYARDRDRLGPPIWCAERFGQSLTLLPDGRIIRIGGEHEDFYDPNFCIYNDVFVHHPNGSIDIYGYPEADFPPTDFHTATLIGDSIYIIGCLGYAQGRRPGETPVYRLDVATLRIERVSTGGARPGWIHGHRAEPVGNEAIRIRGGEILESADGEEVWTKNAQAFMLDLKTLVWVTD